MKTRVLLFCAAFIACTAQQASAKIWRVNNISNFNGTTLFGDNIGGSATNPIFAQVNDAMTWSPVVDGDTLHVEGATNNYNVATVTKKLVIIGSGYYLSENSKVSTNILEAKLDGIFFNTGSEGSQLIGVNAPSTFSDNRIYINVNNIIVKRCKITQNIQLGINTNNINIVQNFFTNTGDGNCLTIFGSDYPSDVVFNNNICQKTLIWDGPITQCNNNVFDGPANILNISITTGDFENNILKPLNATVNINNGTNQNVVYNIGTSSTQFGTDNNNLVVVDMSTLFTSTTGTSTDGKYQIKAGSVADNSGSDGTDRGVFGGGAAQNWYTLSGLAPIPVIYKITSGGVGSGSLPITIQARTIK